jgi:hypothetical protein
MKALLTSILIALSPVTLLAWGGDGHQIVCLIAEERLSPSAKAGIRELLGQDHISDAIVASWADNVRRERRETGPWHYVDIPVDAPAFDEKRDGKDHNNVIEKINDFAKVLADRDASKAERRDALKFLLHFVGDMHQPLHCAERDHDKGGNGRLVFFLDEPRAVNLHFVWDTSILLHRKGTTPILRYAMALNDRISPEQAGQWAKGTAEDWANEGHDLARTVVYAGVPAHGPPPKLDQAYVDRAADVVDQQLEKGGVRLAVLLNRSFAGAPPATAQSRPGEPTSKPVTVDLKDPDALKAAMGSEVIVSGTVASAEWSRTGRVMRIEFNGTEKSRFYAVIFPPQRPAFDQKYSGDVAKALAGAEVQITGKLQLYRERPEIIINRLDQLDVTKKPGA